MRAIKITRAVALTIAGVVVTTAAHAQWVDFKTPGVPRTPDGRVDLAAAVPRTADGKPDLSGLWRISAGIAYGMNIVDDLKPEEVSSAAKNLSRERLKNFGVDDPAVDCLPLGTRYMHSSLGQLAKVIQTSSIIIILFEDLTYRQIFLDGRTLPKDPNPSFMGYSVGHWEGDTLVVESTGFNDRPWLDANGHPHSETLLLTERWRRNSFGEIDLQLTFTDPKFYARPWTVPVSVKLAPDTELIESVCSENEKSRRNMSSPTDAQKTFTLPTTLLSAYVGRYQVASAAGIAGAHVLDVLLVDGELVLDFDGKGKTPLIPLTETKFAHRLGFVEFVRDAQGNVSHLMLNANRAERKR